MKFIIATLLVIGAISARIDISRFATIDPTEVEIRSLFDRYLSELNPNAEDNDHRFGIFKKNLLWSINHNRDSDRTWNAGINRYSAFTLEEVEGKAVMGPNFTCPVKAPAPNGEIYEIDPSLPKDFNWVDYGFVTPVKDQGTCGSCWAFSTTGAMESHWAIMHDADPVSLSEQQLVDCSRGSGNLGCGGGLPYNTFEYIRFAPGIETESDYPYTGKNGECTFNVSETVAQDPFGSFNITVGSEAEMQTYLQLTGPISICFEVVDSFMNYESGVYESTQCSSDPTLTNHCVLITGYGVDDSTNGTLYWIVKNSWGTEWGMEGYFWIERGVNMCGVAACASFPDMYGLSLTNESI